MPLDIQPAPGISPGELDALVAVYNTHYQGFVRFAMTYVGDKNTAEDFVSEAFVAFIDNRRRVREDTNIPAYVLTVVRNKCLNHIKQRGFRDETLKKLNNASTWEMQMRISTLEACDPHELFSKEVQQQLERTLKLLPTRTLEIFNLNRYENKSYREISEMLGISVKGVEFHMTKALGILRRELKDYLPLIIFLGLADLGG